jgi:hypothetical protein
MIVYSKEVGMETQQEIARLRRVAAQLGVRLRKSRLDDRYCVIDDHNVLIYGEGFRAGEGKKLDEVAEFLSSKAL